MIKKNLVRDDILGSIPLPVKITENISFFGYEDSVSNTDSQVMVTVTLLTNGTIKTRGSLTAERWIGFSGTVFLR